MVSYIRNWRAQAFVKIVADRAAKNMKKACEIAVKTAQSTIPKDSGLTAKGISFQVVRRSDYVIDGRVGVTKKSKRGYIAWFLELGTVNMPAKPFLRRAISSNALRIVKVINGG